jgi:outer membrane receptor protein involved in Fe transport
MRVSRNTRRRARARSAGTIALSAAREPNEKAKRAWRCSAGAKAILLGLFIAPSGALAAEADQGPTIGELVVTAQKRAENLQDVPVAITAFTAEMRDKTGIVSAQQQLNFTPGVNYFPGADRITVRGVGRVTTQIGTDNGVAVYQDGFYVGTAGGLGASTLGVERTEVLRGPQGTLYGRNSIGGAVNSISRRPDKEFTGEVRATYNDYSGVTFEGRVSGPVNENLRLSAQIFGFEQEQGFYHNTLPPPSAGSTPGGPNGAGPLLKHGHGGAGHPGHARRRGRRGRRHRPRPHHQPAGRLQLRGAVRRLAALRQRGHPHPSALPRWASASGPYSR